MIALGYGETQGTPHRSKPAAELAQVTAESPVWFRQGVQAAMLAPTAVNQQKFYFSLTGSRTVQVKAKVAPYAKLDLGIAKYHFELGAGKENFDWA